MVDGQGVCIVMQHEVAEGNGECFLSYSMFITYNTCFFSKHFNQCLAGVSLSRPVVTDSTLAVVYVTTRGLRTATSVPPSKT